MKKQVIIWCMVLGTIISAETPEPQNPPLIIHNTNAIKVETKRDPRDCSSCLGTEFKACMRFLTKEDFVANIPTHPRLCTAYVQQLSGAEIVEICKMFTPEEWSALPEVFTVS